MNDIDIKTDEAKLFLMPPGKSCTQNYQISKLMWSTLLLYTYLFVRKLFDKMCTHTYIHTQTSSGLKL